METTKETALKVMSSIPTSTVFAIIHKEGRDFVYLKTTEEGILKIYNHIEDSELTIEQRDGQTWEDNIPRGKSYEIETYHQMVDFLDLLTQKIKA